MRKNNLGINLTLRYYFNLFLHVVFSRTMLYGRQPSYRSAEHWSAPKKYALFSLSSQTVKEMNSSGKYANWIPYLLSFSHFLVISSLYDEVLLPSSPFDLPMLLHLQMLWMLPKSQHLVFTFHLNCAQYYWYCWVSLFLVALSVLRQCDCRSTLVEASGRNKQPPTIDRRISKEISWRG